MRPAIVPRLVRRACASRCLTRLGRDCRGTTALEFSLVLVPLCLMMLGIMTVGLQYFAIQSLEHGVADAARKIKTGQAQKEGKTFSDFRQMVCDAAGTFIKCDDKLVVHVKSAATFAELDPPTPCLTGGELTAAGSVGTDPLANSAGTQSAAVVVTACYEWDQGGTMWQTLWNMLTVGPGTSGPAIVADKMIVQATTTFRTEPYQ